MSLPKNRGIKRADFKLLLSFGHTTFWRPSILQNRRQGFYLSPFLYLAFHHSLSFSLSFPISFSQFKNECFPTTITEHEWTRGCRRICQSLLYRFGLQCCRAGRTLCTILDILSYNLFILPFCQHA